MRLVFRVLVVALLLAPVADARPPLPWHFTREDWAALRASGRDLRMAGDSAWLPARYAETLLRTLRFALRGGPGGPACSELSLVDFFHGHVVCPRPTPEAYRRLAREFHDTADRLQSAALGEEVYDVRPETFAAYTAAVIELERRAGALLTRVEGEKFCAHPAMIFHTVENCIPRGMDYGDPRRNLITPLETLEPRLFEPPSRGSASSFDATYDELFQVVFLADPTGAVHAAPGTERNLSPVLGRPYEQRDSRP